MIALHLALSQPDLVKSLVLASRVFHSEGWLPGVLDGDIAELMRASCSEVSPDRGDHWEVVAEKLRVLHES